MSCNIWRVDQMKKGYIRRAVALSMVGVMMLSGAATGCGKKKVDYNIDGENSGSGSGSSGDSDEYGAVSVPL